MTTPTAPPSNGTKMTGTSVVLQGLTSAKTYYFCVRALCSPTPISGWTCIPFSTENTLSVDGLEGSGPDVTVYPNPASKVVTVSVDKAHNGTITITDIAGRVVYTAAMTTEKADVDVSSFTSGLYLLKYSSEAGNKVVKITKE
jgi:hypothetical protein